MRRARVGTLLSQGRRVAALTTATGVLIATAIVTATAAGAVPLPPPNPSDHQIQSSENQATSSAAEVGRLSGIVSSTQAKIQQLRDAMELKAELAMKARVDLDTAEEEAQDAQDAAEQAQRAADEASGQIAAARKQAAQFAAASFRQGSVIGSMTALLDADSMDDLLARRQMIEQVSGNQAGVLADLESARTHKANLDSKAKAALAEAKDAKRGAEEAKKAADKAQQVAAQAFSDGQQQLDALQSQLEAQQATYQQALNQVADLKSQRAQYNAWVQAKREEDQRLAEQAAIQREHAEQVMREKQLAQERQMADEEARTDAIYKEKRRQEQIRLEQARQAALKKQKAANAGQGPASNASLGGQVVQAALAWLGTPYAWGGGTAKGPSRGIRDYGIADMYGDYNKTGFDCSGLALYAWAQVGVYLPHYSGYQFNYGKKVSRNNLQPGDLVFYAYNTSNPRTIHHVAIYMGNGQMVEAPQSGSVVKISPMRWSGYIGATRPGT